MKFIFDTESPLKLIIYRLNFLVKYLLEVIKEKDVQLEPKFRLVDWIEKKGVGFCKIHTVGTSFVTDYLPSLIVQDDSFISGFGVLDARTITNLANLEKNKPKAVLSSIDYEEGTVSIKKVDASISNLKINSDIYTKIDEFSKSDVFNLGRMVGEKDIQK